jgi:hypothetical protein
MMRRHFVALAAFLVQADPPALAHRVVVLDAHGDDGADASEGEGHDADERPIAQADDGRGVDEPASRYAVMPVARNVWQPILTRVPRSAARRWIMRQASVKNRPTAVM